MMMFMRYPFLGALLLTAVAGLAAAQTPSGPITFERIQNSNREPQNWLTYSGNNMGQRYSSLTQITPQNVKNLELAWLWQARSVEKYEATSIVRDGILYTIQAPNDIVALDATTGRPVWTYLYRNPPEARSCCGNVNRGLAILGETLFMGTLDAHIIAVDAKSGTLLWNTGSQRESDGIHASTQDRVG
jgi:alcohol dehydrogenase (cytochrome c)